MKVPVAENRFDLRAHLVRVCALAESNFQDVGAARLVQRGLGIRQRDDQASNYRLILKNTDHSEGLQTAGACRRDCFAQRADLRGYNRLAAGLEAPPLAQVIGAHRGQHCRIDAGHVKL